MTAPLYFPDQLGADCGRCYLREHRQGPPVGPELNPNAFAAVVGEAPGSTEVETGHPFTGKSGNEATVGFGIHGVRRSHLSWHNTLACHPPDDNLDLLLHKFQRENKRREKLGLDKLPTPHECCKPRLDRELAGVQNIITMGRTAANAVLGQNRSIMDIRGGPVTLDDGRRVMPTVHPAFVMRMRRWTRAYRTDLGRAVRWFSGSLMWREPKVTYNPSPAVLRAFLTPKRAYSYDVETKSPFPGRPELAKDPLLARLGLLGIATDDEVMVIGLLGVDGRTKFYTQRDEAEIIEIVRWWGTDPEKLKIDFNGYYDYQVVKWNLGILLSPRLDNILQHRNVEPELPHGLAYVASTYAEIPRAWKVDHAGTDAETDAEWMEYNAIDCILEHRITAPLAESIKIRNAEVPLSMHHAIQRYCIGLHENGIWINQAHRAKWDVQLRSEAVQKLRLVKDSMKALGMDERYVQDFNPGSVEQLKDLFFSRWGLIPVDYSKKTGEPSTGDETIRSFMRDPKLRDGQKLFFRGLRGFRATTKARGTYVRRMVHFQQLVHKDPLSVDDDEDETTRDEALARKVRAISSRVSKAKGTYGLILGDGRAHANWNAHSVSTGWRLSSSEPNFQNWMRKLREIAAPHGSPLNVVQEATARGDWHLPNGEPIRVYLDADQDQGEMRIIAALAGLGRLLEAFKTGKDPHAINGEAFFGVIFTKAVGKDWDRLRDFSKTAFYALAYKAAFETAYETITSAEDADGNLPFVGYTQRQVRAIIDRFMMMNPELEKWWEAELELYRRQGFLTDPLFGYRCDFLDGEDPNRIVNFRSQSLLGAIVQKAAVQLVDGPGAPLQFGRYGHGTGLVNQGHDRLDFEWPVFHARKFAAKNKKGEETPNFGWCEPGCSCPLEKARQQITEAMHQRVPGLDVQFNGKAQVAVGAWH